MRYWAPWPFGKQKTGIPVADRLMQEQAGLNASKSAIEETRRLLYVSFTRARDLLVLTMPANKSGGEWLDTLEADFVLPDGSQTQLPGGVYDTDRLRRPGRAGRVAGAAESIRSTLAGAG